MAPMNEICRSVSNEGAHERDLVTNESVWFGPLYIDILEDFFPDPGASWAHASKVTAAKAAFFVKMRPLSS